MEIEVHRTKPDNFIYDGAYGDYEEGDVLPEGRPEQKLVPVTDDMRAGNFSSYLGATVGVHTVTAERRQTVTTIYYGGSYTYDSGVSQTETASFLWGVDVGLVRLRDLLSQGTDVDLARGNDVTGAGRIVGDTTGVEPGTGEGFLLTPRDP